MQIIKNIQPFTILNNLITISLFILFATSAHTAEKPVTDNSKNTATVATLKNWRKDPSIKRRPSSYLGGSVNYLQLHAWLASNDDHKKLKLGPLHGFAPTFRVGDALTEYFTLGFQVQFLIAKAANQQIVAFAIMLDATFYPVKGFGIRPSAGFGFSYAQGSNEWDFGFGGPGTLGMALLYEFRLSKVMTLAPIIQSTLVAGEGYRSLAILFGVEVTAWFRKKPDKN